jgi:23S rRNA (adenine2503-C2)-methyltransferase
VDVLGLTFDEVLAELQPRPHQIKAVRVAYRALLHGHEIPLAALAAAPQAAALQANIGPVVRRLRDDELTKFVQQLPDGLETESVVVPMPRTHGIWRTLCVSSQVGCARGCTFCETAQLGLLRNLTPGEIVGQVAAAQRDCADGIRNVVFMGMGEPLDNYDNVIQAIRVLLDPSGLSLAGERVTISTVGRVAGIRKLAALGWRRLNVAVSLNAPNDEIRSQLMPINRLEPMAELRAALLEYPQRRCQFFMIEYVLIPGVNDAREHAREVADYLRPLKCMLNVIPYNPRHDSPWPPPSEESVGQFLGWLIEFGQGCKRRATKGRQHMASCGQLGNRDLIRPRRAVRPEPLPGAD